MITGFGKRNIIQKLAFMRARIAFIDLLPPNFGQAIFKLKNGKFICIHASTSLRFLKGIEFLRAEKLMAGSGRPWKSTVAEPIAK